MQAAKENQEAITMTFSYTIGERNNLQTVLVGFFFSVFIFLMPSKVITVVNKHSLCSCT